MLVRSSVLLGVFSLTLAGQPTLAAPGHGEHGGHGGYAAGEPGDPAKPFRTVEVAMTEADGAMRFTPDRLDVSENEQVKFVITNKGELDHEFILDTVENHARHKGEMEKDAEMAHDMANGVRLAPGKSSEIVWKFNKNGTFEFACLIPGHYEAGMKGPVLVNSADNPRN